MLAGQLGGDDAMAATCAIVVCGEESGIADFFVALYVRYPYTVLSEEKGNDGSYQARLMFENGSPPEEIEKFVCRVHPGIQTGICNCIPEAPAS